MPLVDAGELGMPASWLVPPWTRSTGPVGAAMTTREGGVSSGPYASMNVGDAVGDDPAFVASNRLVLAAAFDACPVFLRQVHGARVVEVSAADAIVGAPAPEADAAWTTEPGVACVVQVADCLPVLFAAPGGRAVGAAHAGWRGLAAGVVEATAFAVADAARCAPGELDVWLGACIGPDAFEVGVDVLEAFGAEASAPGPCFVPHASGKWLADLRGLAVDRLRSVGVERWAASEACVLGDPGRFFSYRRDRVCGRMAAAVWIRGNC